MKMKFKRIWLLNENKKKINCAHTNQLIIAMKNYFDFIHGIEIQKYGKLGKEKLTGKRRKYNEKQKDIGCWLSIKNTSKRIISLIDAIS